MGWIKNIIYYYLNYFEVTMEEEIAKQTLEFAY